MRHEDSAELERCAVIMPGGEPVAIDAGPSAVLLCHGFTGTPTTMRFWAEDLARRGYTVRVPRLPGHGTRWQEMNRVAWSDWVDCVDDAYRALAASYERVAVCGLSMGGALALRLAELHPEIAGVCLVNPAIYATDPQWRFLPAYARVVPARSAPGSDVAQIQFPGVTAEQLSYDFSPLPAAVQMWDMWRVVRSDLHRVTQPLLVFASEEDHVVDPSSVALIRTGVSTPAPEVVMLHDSYHVATVDRDAPMIFERSAAWLGPLLEQA